MYVMSGESGARVGSIVCRWGPLLEPVVGSYDQIAFLGVVIGRIEPIYSGGSDLVVLWSDLTPRSRFIPLPSVSSGVRISREEVILR